MATKSPTDKDLNAGSGKKKKKGFLAVEWSPPEVERHNQFRSKDFSLRVKDPRTQQWVYIDSVLLGMDWGDSDDEVALSGKLSLNNQITANGRRVTDYLPDGAVIRFEWQPTGVPGAKKIEIARFIVWGTAREDEAKGTAEITVYDQTMHLKASHDTFLYVAGKTKAKKVGWTATQITKDICKRFSIPIGHIPKSRVKIPYIYGENKSIYDFLLMVWSQERKETGRRFVVRMRAGRIHIKVKSAGNQIMWELMGTRQGENNIGALISASRVTGMDPGDASSGTATVVTVRGVISDGGDGRTPIVSYTAYNAAGIAQYGTIHKVITIDGLTSKSKARTIATRQLRVLSVPKREMRAEALGIPFLTSGDPIKVRNKQANLAGRYFITNIRHTIEGNGGYKMSCTLSPFNNPEEIFPTPEELKPPTDKNGNAGKPDIMPSWLYPILVKATKAAGVPAKWAESVALANLIKNESDFRPTVKNPSSTAYGLFQFLDSTWAGVGGTKTDDPYLQCVYGLKYIKRRYTTPEKAWKFWQSRSPHWY